MAKQTRSPATPVPDQGIPFLTDPPHVQKDMAEWHRRWQAFQTAGRNRVSWVDDEQPCYWLPKDVINILARRTPVSGPSTRERKPIITEEEAKVEHTFRDLCQTFSTSMVGVWQGEPVHYTPLLPLHITATALGQLGVVEQTNVDKILAAVAAQSEEVEEERRQQLAYAGKLTFDPQYRRERDDLRTIWETLDPKPQFPLGLSPSEQKIPLPAQGSQGSQSEQTDDAVAFRDRTTHFLRRWELSSLATWDLPVPQTPTGPISLALAQALFGPDHHFNFFPNYYGIPSSRNIRQEIRETQEEAGKAMGINAELPLIDLSARAGHGSESENAFRLWVIESAAIQRFSGRHGLATRLIEAFANQLGCLVDRVNRIRKLYIPFLNLASEA
jgi:hypothetical protein